MKNKKIFRRIDIISLIVFIISLSTTVYIVLALLSEKPGIGQAMLSFILIITLVLTLFFGIGLFRHFTEFMKKSKLFYILQTLVSVILPLLVIPIFSSNVIKHSQEEMFTTVKNELAPTITYIEKYQKVHGKIPNITSNIPIKLTTIKNLYLYKTLDNFLLGVNIPSIDIDGAQIFYDSRDKHWYRFHNDIYQHYQDKKDKSKSIQKYVSFQKQTGLIVTTLKKTDGKWVDIRDKNKKSSEDHLTNHKKRCEENHGASCTAGGLRSGMGLGVAQNDSLALKYFIKACKLNDANGCDYLANMYAKGIGVKKERSRAKTLYEKSCKLGNKQACSYITKEFK